MILANLVVLLAARLGPVASLGHGSAAAQSLALAFWSHWPLLLLLAVFLLVAGAAVFAVLLAREVRISRAEFQQELAGRLKTEVALRESDGRYRELFEHLTLGMFQTTLDGKLIRVNQMLATEAGYDSPEEMIAMVKDAGQEFGFTELCPQDALGADALGRMTRNQSPIAYEARFRRKSGEWITAWVTLRLAGQPGLGHYLEGSFEDITERKRAFEFVETQRDLGIKLSGASSLARALPLCLEAAIRTAGMDSGEIYLKDEDGRVILWDGVGFDTQCLARFRSQADLMGELLKKVVEPVYDNYHQCEVGKLSGCRATLGARAIVPIRHEDVSLGWLVVKSHVWQRMPAFSRSAIEAIAAQIGGAIARVQVQEALETSRFQLRALIDSLNDFLLVVDLRGRILDVNRAVTERFGYTREELVGMSITRLYPMRLQLDALTGGFGFLGGEVSFLSAPMVAKDGNVIPVETRLGLGNWEGQQVVIGQGRDLTERRQAEEQTASLREKTALLKEIHHRIKNNLQIICSLLRLQAGRLPPGPVLQAFAESQARVRAIALLHERLYQSRDLSRIELGDYLRDLANELLRNYCQASQKISLRLEAEPAWLNQDSVMPCGLLVNELVTNSCKYAFPNNQPGEIYLSVQQGPDETLILRVGDNGVGMPDNVDPQKANTLGLQLVDDMVSQLKGSWEREREEGTRFRIVFPAEKQRSLEE